MKVLRLSALAAVFWATLLALAPVPVLAESPSRADLWLQKLGPAMNLTTYRGVFVYARGEQVHSMQIAHRYHEGQVQERLVQQDGAGGEILRKGERVLCVLPDHGRVQLDQVIPSGPFAEAMASQWVPDSRWYQSVLLEDDRVAGHTTVQVALEARDAHRYSYRLWLEKNTGLLVKSHVRTASGEVLERFQFTSLEIIDSLPDSEFELQTEGRIIKNRALAGEPAPAESRMSGWRLGWRPDGFVPAVAPRSGGKPAVAFSDGLATFSVFVESTGAMAMPTGVSRIGATTAYMRHVEAGDAGYLITVIGEIPPATAMRLAESVEVDAPVLGGTTTQ
ncbi:MAG: MucB/RseB C-terminal domain-containing protein [Marinobacter sp.]|uniref:MucB/RseB C-terminal domain-containing protein n=1 Tax=Marinobacter sp. TaxID=50741 RepID=UPI00299F1392|nr:MucB/RseB C-terminal domain-containing protein [Marinobacter sp.]MDX1634044.1 MucB/RseB C-terminal domain-containing protein [Marinobacter sp.]